MLEKHSVEKNEVNQDLLIQTLSAIKLKEDDVDDIIDLIKPSQISLTPVKIALYENKQDYVQAFVLQLNNETLKREIFSWLNKTFYSLTIQEKKWRKEEHIDSEEEIE